MQRQTNTYGKINITPHLKPAATKCVKCCLHNIRSLGDVMKTDAICDYVVSNDLDLVTLVETWLLGNDSDNQKISEITPAGFNFYHRPCTSKAGGCVGMLIKTSNTLSESLPHTNLSSIWNSISSLAKPPLFL